MSFVDGSQTSPSVRHWISVYTSMWYRVTADSVRAYTTVVVHCSRSTWFQVNSAGWDGVGVVFVVWIVRCSVVFSLLSSDKYSLTCCMFEEICNTLDWVVAVDCVAFYLFLLVLLTPVIVRRDVVFVL